METVQVGYCTNVHAGTGLEQARANLERFALGVKRAFRPEGPMGVGLWLSAAAAHQLLQRERGVTELGDWLARHGLVPFTLNGFPHGDFHQRVVKHRVYQPTWWEPARLEYTLDLITILDGILPPGMEGSISTLPICWGWPKPDVEELRACSSALRRVADRLAQLEQETGRLIYLCLEPEPGCLLQLSTDVVHFFDFPLGADDRLRRYLRVCHDVCHAAVMFEEQAEVLARYRSAGVRVGKVQVSAAVGLDLGNTPPGDRPAALKQLAEFAEDRYLHQTTVRTGTTPSPRFFEDLPAALQALGQTTGEYRVHFHVPIYLQRFGKLQALQRPILDCLEALEPGEVRHFEVETYAWGVLPDELRQPDLSAGIAQEMSWFADAWRKVQVEREAAGRSGVLP
jgi:hypothetical protein